MHTHPQSELIDGHPEAVAEGAKSQLLSLCDPLNGGPLEHSAFDDSSKVKALQEALATAASAVLGMLGARRQWLPTLQAIHSDATVSAQSLQRLSQGAAESASKWSLETCPWLVVAPSQACGKQQPNKGYTKERRGKRLRVGDQSQAGGMIVANESNGGGNAKNTRVTRPCFDFNSTGKCQYGDACKFAHFVSEVHKTGEDLYSLKHDLVLK